MDYYSQLPPEIKSLIETHLDPQDYYTCTLVNKLFYATTNPMLWQNVVIKDRPTALQFLDCVIEAKNPTGRHVRHLTLHHIKWRNSLFLRMTQRLDGLKELVIPDCTGLTYYSLQHLAIYCPHITTLKLSQYIIDQRSIDLLLQQYPQLRVLELVDCTCHLLESISSPVSCSLEKLHILIIGFSLHHHDQNMDLDNDDDDDDDDDNDNDNDQSVESYQGELEASTAVDLASFHLLTHLNIFGSTFDLKNISLFTPNTTTTHVHCPLLESITIFAKFELKPIPVLQFIKTHPKLKHICIDQGPFTDSLLDAVATYCPDITELFLYENRDITAHGVRRLVRNCPTLRSLDLSDCGIEAHDLPELFGGFGDFSMLGPSELDRIRHSGGGGDQA